MFFKEVKTQCYLRIFINFENKIYFQKIKIENKQ